MTMLFKPRKAVGPICTGILLAGLLASGCTKPSEPVAPATPTNAANSNASGSENGITDAASGGANEDAAENAGRGDRPIDPEKFTPN